MPEQGQGKAASCFLGSSRHNERPEASKKEPSAVNLFRPKPIPQPHPHALLPSLSAGSLDQTPVRPPGLSR